MKSLCVEIVVFVLASVLMTIEGFHMFQKRIPNGDRVPNPCNRSVIWPGVGHQNSAGGGPRNPFGLDFKANGLVWNATICNKDSDGDGMTNGQELGDHQCKWTENETPSGVPMSHPGICEPIDKPDCIEKNSFLESCKLQTFDCPEIKETGVKSFDVRFPVSPVPAQATTYICYQFQFPADAVYDIIAYEPIVDNVQILHHIEIDACVDKPSDQENNQPFDCGLVTPTCSNIIALWTVGSHGHCLNPRVGYRIGPGGFRYGILQLHWGNHELLSGLTDSSGLKIYYTSSLRLYRGEIFGIGQEYIEIPANTPNVVVNGGCSSGCTKQLPRSFNVTSVLFHMHRLGSSGNITLYRDGKYLRTIQDVQAYDSNTPATINFPDPIEILPGDELKISCVYDSTGKMTPTYKGLGTHDEMCVGFLSYFPANDDQNFCRKWKTIEICQLHSYIYSKCNITALILLAADVTKKCSDGCKSTTCKNTMNRVYSTGCPSQPDAMQFLSDYLFSTVLQSNDTAFFQCLNATQPTDITLTDRSTAQVPKWWPAGHFAGSQKVDREGLSKFDTL